MSLPAAEMVQLQTGKPMIGEPKHGEHREVPTAPHLVQVVRLMPGTPTRNTCVDLFNPSLTCCSGTPPGT